MRRIKQPILPYLPMKNKLLFLSRCQIATLGWLASLALLTPGSGSAQNFVRNPGFEEEIGPDNWTVAYTNVTAGGTGIGAANRPTNSCPSDFKVKGRTCISHKNLLAPTGDAWDGYQGGCYWNKMGAHLMANHTWGAHAYFTQVVTNLTPNASYHVSAWIAMYRRTDKTDTYLEALGGLGSRRTVNVTANVDGSGNHTNWQSYAVTNTANASGQIEVRLHMHKWSTIGSWSYREVNAFFDDVVVRPVGQAPYPPSYVDVAMARTNQEITLTWSTIMNNQYRLQCTTNDLDPNSWSFVQFDPCVDPTFFANGPITTFKTNVVRFLSYDPLIDPNGPLYFRTYATSYKQ